MKFHYTQSLIFATVLLAATGAIHADDDNNDGFWKRRPGVAVVTDPLYQKECGSCHMAYQPGLLPARSWQRMMKGLDDHFGDDATLAPDEHARILDYLVKHSADKASHKRSKKIMSSLKRDDAPLRITDTPYIQRKHGELPKGIVGANAKVKSLSQCQQCHTNADKGDYSERGISIPGYGRWED